MRKFFEISLAQGNFIAIEFSIHRGQVLSFVIRLMARTENGDQCVARYDTAHGQAHRDIVSPSGRLLQKDWLIDMSFAEAANYAIHDFKDNHEAYFRQFKANR